MDHYYLVIKYMAEMDTASLWGKN